MPPAKLHEWHKAADKGQYFDNKKPESPNPINDAIHKINMAKS